MDDSYAVLRLHTQDYEIEKTLALEPHSPGSMMLARVFLSNAYIAHHICNAPLFNPIGAFPLLGPRDCAPLLITNDFGGYSALDTNTALYVINCNTKRMTVIPHAPAGNKKIKILFSYDGTAIARISYPEGTDPETTYKNTVTIHASDSGRYLYGITNIGQSLSASPTQPLFIFLNKNAESNVTVLNTYNYKTNTEYEIPLLKKDNILDNTCIKVSPHGTYATFILSDENKEAVLCIHNTITKQRFYLPTQGIANFLNTTDWHRRLHFNVTESMMLLAHDNDIIQLFQMDKLRANTSLQKPYATVRYYNSPAHDPHFSPDGTRLLVPQAGLSAYLYDLITLKKEKTLISKNESGPFFVPQNVVTIGIQCCPDRNHSYMFYLPKTEETLKASSSLHFFNKKMKLAYTQICSKKLAIRDLTTRAEYIAKKGFYKCVSNSQGNLFCINRITLSIEQLMIDPTSCTLEQIFFLLGMARISQDGADKQEMYTQLLSSPILATFSKEVQASITTYLESQRVHLVAPAPDITSAKIKKEVD